MIGTIARCSSGRSIASRRTPRGALRFGESGAREVLVTAGGHDDIIFDPNAAEFAERVDLRPVDVLRVRALLQVAEQRLDEIHPGLDREDMPRLDGRGQ